MINEVQYQSAILLQSGALLSITVDIILEHRQEDAKLDPSTSVDKLGIDSSL